ncbi:hypothetical protein PAXRUDRAFT_76085, partial [Paxillus rubicundulus Ve08.2h10]
GPDGLSRRPRADTNPPILDDHEDWLDTFYSFAIAVINDQGFPSPAVANLSIPPPQHYSNLPPLFYPAFMASLDDATTQPMIPKSRKAVGKEAKLAWIQDFLETRVCPVDLSDVEYASFINSAFRFFLLDGSLWRHEPHSQHQLV